MCVCVYTRILRTRIELRGLRAAAGPNVDDLTFIIVFPSVHLVLLFNSSLLNTMVITVRL